jgi:uncharacterized MAPEG superfamily protein
MLIEKVNLLCLFAAGILPILCAAISKSKNNYDNNQPREWLAKQIGFRSRANAAQQNCWESFLWFTVAIFAVTIFAPDQVDLSSKLSIFYIIFRVLYVFSYVFGFSIFRTVFWLLAQGFTFYIFFLAI